MSDELGLIIDNKRYRGWTSVSLRKGMDTLAGSITLDIVDDRARDPFNIRRGQSFQIEIGGELYMTGYIDDIYPTISSSQYSLSIEGREKTADLIDCSADSGKTSWTTPVSVKSLLNELTRPFGIQTRVERALTEKIERFTISPGETVHEVVRRICNERALLPMTTPEGDLAIVSIIDSEVPDVLSLSGGVLSLKAAYRGANRYSQYSVKAQRSSGGSSWGSETTTQIEGTAVDSEVKRFRPLTIVESGNISKGLAQKKASWEAQIRAGQSEELDVTVQGWTWPGEEKRVWRPNTLVTADFSEISIPKRYMIISFVNLRRDSTGTMTDLILKSPDSYAEEPPKEVIRPERQKSGWEL